MQKFNSLFATWYTRMRVNIRRTRTIWSMRTACMPLMINTRIVIFVGFLAFGM